ncbi:DUF3558 domain-containing protein, partial [Actinophytocola sp.]|uniref:DUF3558 domain-containing protein n=1 Tax=Actinophytocola sp. TaxID=1872138 RepID=UPI002ED2C0FC
MPRRLVATAIAFLFLLAGCSEKTIGSPSPDDSSTEPTATTEQSTEETTSGQSPSGDLADVEPCELLDDTEKASLQLTGGQGKTVGQARVCEWRREGPTINETFTIGVALFENLTIDDIVGTNIQRLPKIGNHDAATYTGTTGFCGVSIAVGEKSRVDVNSAGGDQQEACPLVTQLATF